MAGFVRVGGVNVSAEAYAYARAQVGETKSAEGTESKTTGKDEVTHLLEDLSRRYTGTSFSIGSKPGMGTGTNNIAIAPGILREMAENPEKRLEIEAKIYDCVNAAPNWSQLNPTIKDAGFLIMPDGSMAAWSRSANTGSGARGLLSARVGKNEKANWMAKLLEKLKEKQRERQEQEKASGETSMARVVRKKPDDAKHLDIHV